MSTPITPALIKQLRDRTGVGVGKCKAALEEAKGDIETAIANLRKAGMASAVKKEGREANEGKIVFAENENSIAVVELNAETDFVANNEKFLDFLQNITQEALRSHPPSREVLLETKYPGDPSQTIEEIRASLVQMIGENIQVGRVIVLPKKGDSSFGLYSHMGGKIVAIVELKGSSDEAALAREIAMHTAAAAPEYVSPDQIPASVLEHEKEIARSQVQNKPAHILDKIIEGKLKAYYSTICLLDQQFIKDDSKSIAMLVEERGKAIGKPLTVARFLRWSVGES